MSVAVNRAAMLRLAVRRTKGLTVMLHLAVRRAKGLTVIQAGMASESGCGRSAL